MEALMEALMALLLSFEGFIYFVISSDSSFDIFLHSGQTASVDLLKVEKTQPIFVGVAAKDPDKLCIYCGTSRRIGERSRCQFCADWACEVLLRFAESA